MGTNEKIFPLVLCAFRSSLSPVILSPETTADDGLSCIISFDGFRYKPFSITAPATGSLGGVFAHAAVSHQYVTGLDTAGNLLRAQPSLSDLSDSSTVVPSSARA